MAACACNKKYRFYPKDFQPVETTPLHLDLLFDIYEKFTIVTATSTFLHRVDNALSVLKLNSNNLEIQSFEIIQETTPLGADGRDFVGHVASFASPSPLEFEVDAATNSVQVTLPSPIENGQEFTIRSVSICRPTSNVLEGLYFDYTPKGCPPTMITQCQQYGFQRMVPSLDCMDAKTFYTTTIVADCRYTRLISNGDLAPEYAQPDTGAPLYHSPEEVLGEGAAALAAATMAAAAATATATATAGSGDGDGAAEGKAAEAETAAAVPARHVVRYHNHLVPMAPYLFFLSAGTYDTYRRQLEYPSGDTFAMELLVFPTPESEDAGGGAEAAQAARVACAASLDSLHGHILWTQIDTGPSAPQLVAERAAIHALLEEREALKAAQAPQVLINGQPLLLPAASGEAGDDAAAAAGLSEEQTARLAAVRAELAAAMGAYEVTGYTYTGKVYREIAMENSDYGGMENVGNTTIITACLTPGPDMSDASYVYMEAVKVHEYYHNINGSQVTGQSPFQLWLNEAVTVFIERKRCYDLFSKGKCRLNHYRRAVVPAIGSLAQDRGPLAMAIEPEGFNRTQELISAVTYAKAPEFVGMVETLLTPPVFARGLHLYYTRFAFRNALTADWIAAMEEVSGLSLQAMAKGWLARTGYPDVTAVTAYDADAGTYTITLTQTGFEVHDGTEQAGPWDFPVAWCLVDGQGQETHSGVQRMSEPQCVVTVEGVAAAPAFLSLARDWSFFGTSTHANATEEAVAAQALLDSDPVNRFLAYRRVTEQVKGSVLDGLLQAAAEAAAEAEAEDGGEGKQAAAEEEAEAAAAAAAGMGKWVDLHLSLLFNEQISGGARALLLSEPDSILSRPELSHHYDCIRQARTALYQALADAAAPRLLQRLKQCLAESAATTRQLDGMGARSLADLLLSILAHATAPRVLPPAPDTDTAAVAVAAAEALSLTEDMLASRFVSLQYSGFITAMSFLPPGEAREALRLRVRQSWCARPNSTERYIRSIMAVDAPDSAALVEQLMADPAVNLDLAGHARCIAHGWAAKRHLSLLTEDGLALTLRMLLQVGRVNQMSAYPILKAFGDLARFSGERKKAMTEALQTAHDQFDPVAEQSLFNQLTTLLGTGSE